MLILARLVCVQPVHTSSYYTTPSQYLYADVQPAAAFMHLHGCQHSAHAAGVGLEVLHCGWPLLIDAARLHQFEAGDQVGYESALAKASLSCIDSQ